MPDVRTRLHAKLSASGAHRWMACTPSAALEADIPDETSEFAKEGTQAHELAELICRYNNGEMTKKSYNARLKKLQASEYWNEEMQQYINDYTDKVWEIFNEVKKTCSDAEILFEQRLDFSAWVEEGFGTGDVVIIADGTMQVIDLKYGKGVGVSAINNPQLRLYGLGAVDSFGLIYDIDRVKMTIIQPRLENTSTEELTVEELVKWAEEEVKPKAELAYAGEGEYCAGDHCRFCKAKATCRARAEENQKLTQYDFKEPPMLTPAEVSDVLSRIDNLVKWAEDVKAYALDAMLNKGISFEGFKVVEGRSIRKYSDEQLVVDALAGIVTEDQMYNKKLKSITDMTKLLGGKEKFEQILGAYVVEPQGSPVLVPESDKRPHYEKASAESDFGDDLLD